MFRRHAVGSAEDEMVYASAQLSMHSERDGDVHLIALIGDLDIAGAPVFEHELKRVENSDASEIVVDLRGLDFISSDGLKALIHAESRSRGRHNRLRLVPGSNQVQRTFETAGLVSRLPFDAGRELRLEMINRPPHARVVLALPVRNWRG
ncbi:MAG TPA: STAS domain-containing protein [Solirubrobacteraceae bacterium]|nr:STAS domain-containing protein [Solirubrobacteraceae bacterium]